MTTNTSLLISIDKQLVTYSMSSKNFDYANTKNISHLGLITKSEWKDTSILQDRRKSLIHSWYKAYSILSKSKTLHF